MTKITLKMRKLTSWKFLIRMVIVGLKVLRLFKMLKRVLRVRLTTRIGLPVFIFPLFKGPRIKLL